MHAGERFPAAPATPDDSGSGANTALAFTTLKEWGQRDGATAASEAEGAQEAFPE
ncbi:hypothetical protein [Vreelandella aquamarina]|uniref:hypothetical protein n=1 Tax=Vreelandella aquamarina TaxID=77097 RepID=UPI0038517987